MTLEKSSTSRAWQHVDGPSEEERKKNRYLNPKTDEEPASPDSPSPASSTDVLRLDDISCFDGEGNRTEHYPKLYVLKDVFRRIGARIPGTTLEKPVEFTIPEAIDYCETYGLFLPSMALTCSIITRLYEHWKTSPEAKAVLDQYNDYGPGFGLHVTNTLTDALNSSITHYPNVVDGEKKNLRGPYPPIKYSYNISISPLLKNLSIDDAFKDRNFRRPIKDLTGFGSPDKLTKIVEYFGGDGKILPPSLNQTRGNFIGSPRSSMRCFYLMTFVGFHNRAAARGVFADGGYK